MDNDIFGQISPHKPRKPTTTRIGCRKNCTASSWNCLPGRRRSQRKRQKVIKGGKVENLRICFYVNFQELGAMLLASNHNRYGGPYPLPLRILLPLTSENPLTSHHSPLTSKPLLTKTIRVDSSYSWSSNSRSWSCFVV